MVKVESGIRAAVEQLQADGGLQAAEAIMTTDTTVKSAAYQVEIGGQTVTVGGIAKGQA